MSYPGSYLRAGAGSTWQPMSLNTLGADDAPMSVRVMGPRVSSSLCTSDIEGAQPKIKGYRNSNVSTPQQTHQRNLSQPALNQLEQPPLTPQSLAQTPPQSARQQVFMQEQPRDAPPSQRSGGSMARNVQAFYAATPPDSAQRDQRISSSRQMEDQMARRESRQANAQRLFNNDQQPATPNTNAVQYAQNTRAFFGGTPASNAPRPLWSPNNLEVPRIRTGFARPPSGPEYAANSAKFFAGNRAGSSGSNNAQLAANTAKFYENPTPGPSAHARFTAKPAAHSGQAQRPRIDHNAADF